MLQTIPTAEPFFFPGKPGYPGCLLIHGFTGAPKEMRWMGEYLAEQGFNVLGVRLAGHATRSEDMIRARYTDWTASVEDGYNLLRGASEHIFLMGLSMGGVLSLLMSTRLPVRGVMTMSTPYAMPPGRDYPVWWFRLLSLIVPYQPKTKGEPGSGWFDKTAWVDHISYPQNPIRSAAELKLLLAEMRAALPKVDVPALLVHSRDDTYVPAESMQLIYDQLGTYDKQMLWLTGSGHVIPREPPRIQAFQAATEFIRRVEAS
jgi:carboxylesterase